MSYVDRVLEDDRIREFWPGIVGGLVVIVGQLYMLSTRGTDLTPLGIPLFAGLLTMIVLEAVKTAYERNEGAADVDTE